MPSLEYTATTMEESQQSKYISIICNEVSDNISSSSSFEEDFDAIINDNSENGSIAADSQSQGSQEGECAINSPATSASSSDEDLASKMWEGNPSWSWQDEMDFWEEEGMETEPEIKQPQLPILDNAESDTDTLINDDFGSDPTLCDDAGPCFEDYYTKFNSDGYPAYLALPIPLHVTNEYHSTERTFPTISPLSKNPVDVLDVKGHSTIERLALREEGFNAQIQKVTSGELRVLLDNRLYQYRCKPSNLRSSVTAI